MDYEERVDARRLCRAAADGCCTTAELATTLGMSIGAAAELELRAEARGWLVRTRSGWVLCPPMPEEAPTVFAVAMDVAAAMRLGEVMTTLQLVERVRLATGCARRSAERAVYMLGEFGVLACCGRRRHGGQLWTPADGVRSV